MTFLAVVFGVCGGEAPCVPVDVTMFAVNPVRKNLVLRCRVVGARGFVARWPDVGTAVCDLDLGTELLGRDEELKRLHIGVLGMALLFIFFGVRESFAMSRQVGVYAFDLGRGSASSARASASGATEAVMRNVMIRPREQP